MQNWRGHKWRNTTSIYEGQSWGGGERGVNHSQSSGVTISKLPYEGDARNVLFLVSVGAQGFDNSILILKIKLYLILIVFVILCGKNNRLEQSVAPGSEGKDASNSLSKMKLRTSIFQGITLNTFYFAKCTLVVHLQLGCLFHGERNRAGSS